MKLLITGGAGFIGSHFVDLCLRKQFKVAVVDSLTYAGVFDNIRSATADPNFLGFREVSIAPRRSIYISDSLRDFIGKIEPDVIVNFAAESHVDRSIISAQPFVNSNVAGTQNLLDIVRELKPQPLFIQVSTDEVYGSVKDHPFRETDHLQPSSPYSASKASADLFCLASHHTFGTRIRITRCSNNYGPRQLPEKLIPLALTKLRSRQPVPVYGNGLQKRDWIHVSDHCSGILATIERGKDGEIYNFGGGNCITNLDLVNQLIHGALGPEVDPREYIQFVTDRPGHDLVYEVDSSKAQRELCWAPTVDFTSGLRETITWYRR